MRFILTNRNRFNRAFTLIEMLVVVSMVFFVSLAVYATLSAGLRIWKRINVNTPGENISIFFEKFTSDLKNTVKFSSLSFSGAEDSFEFVSLVESHRIGNKTIGKIVYSFNNSSRSLKRYEKDIAHIFREEPGIEHNALSDIRAVRFYYYHYDKENDYYTWEDEWGLESIPLAIRLELTMGTENASEKFTKTVSIPVGG